MSSSYSYGIIGNLYNELKKLSVWRKQEDFYEALGMDSIEALAYKSSSGRKTMFYDYFTEYYYKGFIEQLESNLEKKISANFRYDQNCNQVLINLTQRKFYYCNKVFSNISKKKLIESNKISKELIEYNAEDFELLKSYFCIYKSRNDFIHNLYLILYLAIKKELPKDLLYGTTFENQLKEFTDNVTKLYGTTSDPATRAILRLADNNNIIAKYEKADFYYYGNRRHIPKNIPKAYQLYKEVAGLNLHSELPEESLSKNIHPLALWSLAYILFNYRNNTNNNRELEDCVRIKEIDLWLECKGRLFVIAKAVIYAKFAMRLIDCAPAANILGKIAMMTDSDLKGIEKLKSDEKLLSAEEYFKIAANMHYVYSINLLALIECNKVFEDPENERIHVDNYLKYMKESANLYESWACTELGNFYRTRVLHQWEKDFSARKSVTKIITSLPLTKSQMLEESLNYYTRASKIELDVSSGWSCYNILCFFKEYVLSENKVREYVMKIEHVGNELIINKTKQLITNSYNLDYEDILKKEIKDEERKDNFRN